MTLNPNAVPQPSGLNRQEAQALNNQLIDARTRALKLLREAYQTEVDAIWQAYESQLDFAGIRDVLNLPRKVKQ